MTARPGLSGTTGEKQRRRQHQWTWLAVILVGGVVLLVCRLLDASEWAIAVLLSLMMIVYCLVVRGNESVSPDAKGDGVYYLGLLFTFASMVAALLEFTGQVDDWSSSEPMSLVGNLGIALLTTIVGLAARVLFSVFQESAGDIAGTAVRSIDEAVANMRERLVLAAQSMENLHGHAETAAERLKETNDEIAEAAASSLATAKSFEGYSKEIAGMSRSFADGIGDLDESVAKIGTTLATMEGPVDGARKQIGALGAEAKELGRALGAARQGLLGVGEGAQRAERELTVAGGEATKAFAEAATKAADLKDASDRAGTELESAAAVVAREGERVAAPLREAGEAASALRSSAEQAHEEMGELRSAFRDAGERARSVDRELAGLGEAAKEAREQVVAVAAVAGGVQSDLAEPSAEAGKQIAEAGSQAARAAGDLDQLTDQLAATERQLAELTRDSSYVAAELRKDAERRKRGPFRGWGRRLRRLAPRLLPTRWNR